MVQLWFNSLWSPWYTPCATNHRLPCVRQDATKEIFGSNLVLANREARLTAPSGEDLSGQNAWAALCAANEKVGQFSESQILVGGARIELATSVLSGQRSTTELATLFDPLSQSPANGMID